CETTKYTKYTKYTKGRQKKSTSVFLSCFSWFLYFLEPRLADDRGRGPLQFCLHGQVLRHGALRLERLSPRHHLAGVGRVAAHDRSERTLRDRLQLVDRLVIAD